MSMEEKEIKRVAVYTRKSTEEGLDMEFNRVTYRKLRTFYVARLEDGVSKVKRF